MTDSARETQYVPKLVAISAAWAWRLLLLAFAAALLALILFELRLATVPVFVAILLTTLLLPPVQFLRKRGVGGGLATAIVFFSAVVIIAGIIVFGSSAISAQFSQLGPQITTAVNQVNEWLRNGPLQLSDRQIDQYVNQAVASARSNTAVVGSGLVSSATFVGEVVTGVLVAIVLAFFFTRDGEEITKGTIKLFPPRHREMLHAAAHRAFSVLAGYLRGVALTGIVDSVLISIGLAIIGVPLIAPLAILTFFGAFFPLVGATVAGALAALVALVNGGPGDALWVIVVVLVVQQIEGQLLQPLLVGRAVSLHPAVIIVALVSGSVIAGLLGAFLAIPLTAVIVGVIREVTNRYPSEVVAGGMSGQIGSHH